MEPTEAPLPLFDEEPTRPLADRLRPTRLDDVVGQDPPPILFVPAEPGLECDQVADNLSIHLPVAGRSIGAWG